MRACAEKGGVVGLSGFGLMLGANCNLVERLVRQLRYTIDLIGAEHVGLGLDYVFDRDELDEFVRSNPNIFPTGMKDASRIEMIEPESLEEIAEDLAKSNLSDEQVYGVLGNNWLRVASQVWR